MVRLRKIPAARPVRVLSGMIAFTMMLVPQAGQGASLEDILFQGRAQSSELGAAQDRLRARREGLAQANALFMPRIDIQGSVERTDTRVSGSSRELGTPASLGLVIQQSLFDGGKARATRLRARTDAANAAAATDDIEQNVLLQIVTAYADVRRDRDVLALRRAAVSAFQSQLNGARSRQAAGDASRTDVAQTSTRLALARSDLAQAEADLATSEAEFARVTGERPGDLEAPSLPLQLAPESVEKALAIAMVENPALRAAAYAAISAQYDTRIAATEGRARIYAEAGVVRERNPSSDVSGETAGRIGLKLTVPLFDGGLARSKLREARAIADSRKQDAGAARLLVEAGVRRTFAQWQASNRKITAAEAEVGAASVAVAGTAAEVAVGERGVLDELDARRDLISARVGLAQARRDQVVAFYGLISTLGRLRPDIVLPRERGQDIVGAIDKPAAAVVPVGKDVIVKLPVRPLEAPVKVESKPAVIHRAAPLSLADQSKSPQAASPVAITGAAFAESKAIAPATKPSPTVRTGYREGFLTWLVPGLSGVKRKT